jgi:ABC-type bacteriocin/lantibiotic exporter with double-glycine peptidase domain
MQSSSIQKLLPKNSIFSLLPESWEALESSLSLELVTAGTTIFKKGERINRLIIPLNEDLKLITGDKTSFLQKGRTLALGQLLLGELLPYDVVAEAPNRLLVIPLDEFNKYLNEKPDYKAYLHRITLSAAFRNFKHYLLEKGVGQDLVIKLSPFLKEWSPQEGLEGKLILIDQGTGRFQLLDEDRYTLENAIRPGIWFGGFSLIANRKLPYSIDKSLKLKGFAIEAPVLEAILNPQILEYLAIDPWVGLTKKDTENHLDAFKTLTKLPVLPLSSEELFKKYDFNVDETKVLKASDDVENIPRTVFNALSFYHHHIDFTTLNQFVLRALTHVTWSSLASAIENFGFVTRSMTSSLEDIAGISEPFFFFVGNRLVCCLKSTPKELICLDGIDGFYRLMKKDLDERWEGSLLTFKLIPVPLTTFPHANEDEKRKSLSKAIIAVLAEDQRAFGLIGILTLLIYGLGSFIPHFSQILLDEVLRTEDDSTLLMCVGGILVSSFSIILFSHLKNRITNMAALKFDQKFSTFLYKKSLELPSADLARLEVGGVINRLSEAEKLRQFFSIESVNSIMNLGSVIVYSAVLLTYSPTIVAIPLVYLGIMFVTVKYFRRKIYMYNLEVFNLSSRINTFISECVSKVLAIKAFGAGTQMAGSWDDLLTRNVEASYRTELEASKMQSLTGLFSQLTQIGSVWIIVYLIFSKQTNFSLGEIFAITMYIQMIISPLGGLVDFVERIEDVRLSLDKLSDIFFPQSISEKATGDFAFGLEGKIKLDRVGFKYSSEGPWILRDISLTIYPGQIIALVGKSGSGKTTLANILAREAEATTGRVFYDDYDVNFLEKNNLKSQIGYIQQNNELFSGTMRSNVAYKDASPSEELLHFALKHSNSEGFISAFPQGDNTYLAEGGMGLSGGQKQRISIARVLYMNPKVIIMDEATSALDSESETGIVESMKEISKSRTSIIIAHRLSTIRHADLIFVVDQGMIVQQGNHNELIKVDGVYKELFQDQAS